MFLLGLAEEFSIALIEGIYSTVADVYNGLLLLIEGISDISGYFSGAIDALYTLIGIFMLFRIGISLITMLVDPDKINDKQEGAGKLLSRIIIAVVLVLTLNSFIFPLLSRVEDAVVDQIGGFAQKIFQVNAATTTHSINSSFIMNIDAEEKCTCAKGVYDNGKCISWTYPKSARGTNYCTEGKLQNYGGKLACVEELDIKPECKKVDGNAPDEHGCKSNQIFLGNMCVDTCGLKSLYHGYKGCEKDGYTMISETICVNTEQYYEAKKNVGCASGEALDKDGNCVDAIEYGNNMQGIASGQTPNTTPSKNQTTSQSDERALKFARALASAFVSAEQEGEQSTVDTWFDYENGEFLKTRPATGLRTAYSDNKVSIDILMGIIMAIVAIAFLVILMMDIVVRGLKLIILQVISPIAVLSYINPKDKIFNQWVKMYGSTYADLFLKLLAVSLIPYLLEAVLGNSNNPFAGHAFLKIIYILGIFLFAKGLPELISNVFGIKAAGGTFKEAAGIAKKGLGIGAGVAAGAIGASSILAHGGSLGSAANTIKAGFGGAKNVKSAKAEGIKQAYARRDSGQKWLSAEKNALKSHVPFMRTDKEKAERRISELSRQQSTFKEADDLLEKDKGVMAASDILSQYRTDGKVADDITNYNQLIKDETDEAGMETGMNMYAKLRGYKKEGNNWVQRKSDGTEEKLSNTEFVSKIKTDTDEISNVDQISRMKENIAIAKTKALKDPSSAVGQQAKEVLKYNGGDGTDYDAYDKANKAAGNEIRKLKHDNFIS